MKVLLVSHGSGPYGAERILLELARRLAERGHAIVLSLPHEGPAVDLAKAVPGIELRVEARTRLPRNVGEGVAHALAAPADILRVRRIVMDVRPDVTWVNSMFNAWAAVGARLARSATVWQMHERAPRGPAGLALAALAGWTADRVVVVSEYVAGTFRRFPWVAARLEVRPNPLLHTRSHVREPPPGPFTVGYVGQLEPRKRAPDLIRAIALLPRDVRAVVVGDGKARRAVEAALRESGVEDRVVLKGYSDDVPREMERFHCLAMPAVREPFGLVVVEAMAMGVPIVAARSGALPEVLGDVALFHEPTDPADLARQLGRLRGDPELAADLSMRGRQRAAAFGVESWIAAVEDTLASVAHVGSRPKPASASR